MIFSAYADNLMLLINAAINFPPSAPSEVHKTCRITNIIPGGLSGEATANMGQQQLGRSRRELPETGTLHKPEQRREDKRKATEPAFLYIKGSLQLRLPSEAVPTGNAPGWACAGEHRTSGHNGLAGLQSAPAPSQSLPGSYRHLSGAGWKEVLLTDQPGMVLFS